MWLLLQKAPFVDHSKPVKVSVEILLKNKHSLHPTLLIHIEVSRVLSFVKCDNTMFGSVLQILEGMCGVKTQHCDTLGLVTSGTF